MKAKIAVSLLTGFLGSGKTTLLSRLLTQPELANAVIIINEFGAVSIDHLIVANLSESVVELKNGCLCCTIRTDLVMTLRDLFRQRQLGEIRPFDRVIVETSGLANPIPLLHTLMANPPLMQVYEVDSVVTVVDAVNAATTLPAHQTASDQVALADLIVVSKQDIATPVELAATEALLATLNPRALRYVATDGNIASQQLFGRRLFQATLSMARHGHDTADATHAGHDHAAHHYASHVIVHPAPLSLAGTTVFLNRLVNEQREEILRIKGIAGFREKGGRPAVIHAVQNKFYPLQWLSDWPDSDTSSRLVFIGRTLNTSRINEQFAALSV